MIHVPEMHRIHASENASSITMEYIPIDFQTMFARPLPLPTTLSMFRQLMLIVGELHKAGIAKLTA